MQADWCLKYDDIKFVIGRRQDCNVRTLVLLRMALVHITEYSFLSAFFFLSQEVYV